MMTRRAAPHDVPGRVRSHYGSGTHCCSAAPRGFICSLLVMFAGIIFWSPSKSTPGRNSMRRILIGLCSLAAAMLAASPANAQGTIKIGLIMPYSGRFADTATQMDNAIKLYVKQHGDTVAGRKLEFVRKDTGGIAPEVAKRLAQELVVRDKVDLLA